MLFQIKCSNKQNAVDIYKIMQSHIINSPDDRNNQDCILYLTSYEKQLTPIYEITKRDFIQNYWSENGIIEFNNSTSVVALEFISDSIGSFIPIGNDTFILNY